MSHELFFSDSILRISIWPAVVVHDVAGKVTVDHMLRMEKAYLHALAASPKGVVGISLLQPGTPVAGDDARAEGARFVRDLGNRVPRVAMVVEATGVGGAAMRTVIRAVNVVSRTQSLVVCASLSAGVAAVAPVLQSLTGKPVDQAGLIREIEATRTIPRTAVAS
jgi:hypothetical protein